MFAFYYLVLSKKALLPTDLSNLSTAIALSTAAVKSLDVRYEVNPAQTS